MVSSFEYDVALSFASEDRPYVEAVAEALRRAGVRVFYDRYEEVGLWGKNLYEHLDQVYRQRARFCVIFVSKHYAGKLWTSHERKSAQARALGGEQDYILPARFDDTEIPGLLPTVGYMDLRQRNPEELALLVRQKIASAHTSWITPVMPNSTGAHSFISERSAYWRERGSRLWLVAALTPRGPAKVEAHSDSILNVLHDLNLPSYLAEPLTAAPNKYKTRSTQRSMVHEDFRMLDKGVAFRFEIQESGLIEYAICLDELLSRFPIDLVRQEVTVWFLPGSAPLDQCEKLLAYHPFGTILLSQIQALVRLWNEPPIPIEHMTLSVALFGVKEICLLVSGYLDARLGYPCEDEEILVTAPVERGEEHEALFQSIFPVLIRAFGLRLDKVYDEKGELNRPSTFAG